ncbi:hypothetical protein ABEY46_16970 [Bacillus velezensis]|uniref:hypothetical protein n=1 Tax=Bacillus velezensis TaxID=492670 RepID=UPI002DBAC667|nr:hypothetical protein [Bacillus velezensis]MEC1896665.1 hypothetical protein [Bacillus velezensis]MEC1916971.1 hypothetical protein [Bacillus velezensis]MEC3797938.1 hypothetical protein [Bacillus velezensis]
MVARQKESVRLDPEITSLGRKLAKKDFGSESKFGLLIEHAIRAYHAHQVQPVEASSLLSATEQALIDRIEKRVEDMGKQTVERVGNLIAKSSYETTYSSIMLEQIFDDYFEDYNPKQLREQMRGIAAQRMRTRLDKESAQKISSLMQENKNLEVMQEKLINMNNEQQAELEKYKRAYQELRRDYQDVQEESNSRLNQVGNAQQQNDQLLRKIRSLQSESAEYKNQTEYLVANYSRLKSNEKLLEEYKQERR